MQLLWKVSLCQYLSSDRLRIAEIKKNMKDFGVFLFSKNKICVVVAKWQPGVHVPESGIMGIVVKTLKSFFVIFFPHMTNYY